MTIEEYINQLPEGANKESMFQLTSIWSLGACKGYCIAAMMNAGFTPEQMDKVLFGMEQAYVDIELDEAEGLYAAYKEAKESGGKTICRSSQLQ